MKNTKYTFLLLVFVLLMGCFTLNKSYSLFVVHEESDSITTSIIPLTSTLSINTLNIENNKSYLIKETITNTSTISMIYVLNATYDTNINISLLNTLNNNLYGYLEPNETKDIYLYITNTSLDTSYDITFNVENKYTTINYEENELLENNKIDYINKYTLELLNKDSIELTIPDNITGLEYTLLEKTSNGLNLNILFKDTDKLELPLLEENYLTYEKTIYKDTLDITNTDPSLVKINNEYYFRGNVIDNYVNYKNMCYRIVSINNDSIKLILEDKNTTCESTEYTGLSLIGEGKYTYLINDDNKMDETFKAFESNINKDNLNNGSWCIETYAYNDLDGLDHAIDVSDNYKEKIPFYYETYVRMNKGNISLTCKTDTVNKYVSLEDMYVSTLTLDELIISGVNYNNESSSSYILNNDDSWWTLTPSKYNEITEAYNIKNKQIESIDINTLSNYRPVINLKNTSLILKGNGYKETPYVIG